MSNALWGTRCGRGTLAPIHLSHCDCLSVRASTADGPRERADAIDLLNRIAAMSSTIEDYNQRLTRAQ